MDTSSAVFEVMLFRSVIQHRPVGAGRHFSMAGMLSTLSQELGPKFNGISPQDVWKVLEKFYNLSDLDSLDEAYNDTRMHDFKLEKVARKDAELASKMEQRRFRGSPSPSHHGNSPLPRNTSFLADSDGGSPLTDPGEDSGSDASPRKSNATKRSKGKARQVREEPKEEPAEEDYEDPDAEAEDDDEEEDEDEEEEQSDASAAGVRSPNSKRARTTTATRNAGSRANSGTRRGRTSMEPASTETSPKGGSVTGEKKLSGAALAARRKKVQKESLEPEAAAAASGSSSKKDSVTGSGVGTTTAADKKRKRKK